MLKEMKKRIGTKITMKPVLEYPNNPVLSENNRIICVMAIHRRKSITIETLKMLKNQTMPIDILVVGDSNKEHEIAKLCDCFYLEYKNKPLSEKWQQGILAARKLDPEAIMICGSDSWLTKDWCEVLFPHTRKSDLVGINNFYACKAYPNQKVKIIHREYQGHRKNLPVGSGRMFSRSILDNLNWIIYPKKINRALDSQAHRILKSKKAKISVIKNDKLKVLAVKSIWESLNSWEKYIKSNKNIKHPDIMDPKSWLDDNFPGSVDALTRVMPNVKW